MVIIEVTLHSDAIERFEKIYPELVKSGDFRDLLPIEEMKQDYLRFLSVVQELDTIYLIYENPTLQEPYFRFYYPCDDLFPDDPEYKKHNKYIHYYIDRFSPLPERVVNELVKEIVHDERIDLGFCVQCQLVYPIETGCTQTTFIYGKCDPKNFIPFLDKEGKKVFKGSYHYKKFNEWNPDEFVPYSPEKMEKNREFVKRYNAKCELELENCKKQIELGLIPPEAIDSLITWRYKEF